MYSSVPSPPWHPGPSQILERPPSSPPLPSPTSPTRSSRLRGLSYLRTYTQNHILSRDSHHHNSNSQQRLDLSRISSEPSPTTSPRASATPSVARTPLQSPSNPRQTSPTAQRTTDTSVADSHTQDNLNSTSGWLPTVGGQSGVSRTGSQPQSTATGSSSAVLSGNDSSAVASELTASMTRTRTAATAVSATDTSVDAPRNDASAQNGTPNAKGMSHQLPSIRFTAHHDPRAIRPSLTFNPMARILPTGTETIKVGRYSERDAAPTQAPNVPSSAPVGFKSKVVSRRHCEFWCSGGRWYIKDVKSSSGTFLNHIRLSPPGTESKPYPVNDGDIVQLGIDFKGGEEMIFRCVKIRVELNKGWQTAPSSFNVQSHKRLRELNNSGKSSGSGTSQDCAICLGPIAPCQSLFVAPCSHTWHYKCIRVIINGPHWPHFICPNCRSVADLEAELDDPETSGEWAAEVADGSADQPEVEPAQDTTKRRNEAHSTEATHAGTDESGSGSGSPDIQNRNGQEIVAQDGSDPSQYELVVGQLEELNIEGPESPDTAEQVFPASNATVPPVDIVGRGNRVPDAPRPSVDESEQLSSNARTTTRTPSPDGTSSSLDVILTTTEGPMTPRNDVGPFIFDGSGGRMAPIDSVNPNETAETPAPRLAPQTVP
ncbi:hypothetical protein HYFRA_00011912 [Hymenoscyphus fraxineus]|uniref:RING-type E3 ubiquitin transferase n=1 Tax=Hymenoscyphus fraxineus TaxID=746836 RepID=A0A9N9PR80_9HELO|nr:hypothetical protein HYFRA_00011912 [Hymenoscyphus fraxineus]